MNKKRVYSKAIFAILIIMFVSYLNCTRCWAVVRVGVGLILDDFVVLGGSAGEQYKGLKHLSKGGGMVRIKHIDGVSHYKPEIKLNELIKKVSSEGSSLVILNSSYQEKKFIEAVKDNPKINFIKINGEEVLKKDAPKNLSNLAVRIETGEMIVGFLAAISTKTGKIGYIGSNKEARAIRSASSCFLGAKYAWENVLKKDSKIEFKVVLTNDSAGSIAEDLYNAGYDVLISSLYDSKVMDTAIKKNKQNQEVWAIPYGDIKEKQRNSKACLGNFFINWYPAYLEFVKKMFFRKWESEWLWLGPHLQNIRNRNESPVIVEYGRHLSAEIRYTVDNFINELAMGRISLLKGPLFYKDGTVFLKEGEIASDYKVWNMKQLLYGID